MAYEMKDRLSEFGRALGNEAMELKRAVEETVSLLEKYDAQTVDALSQYHYHLDRKAIVSAKQATAALFLSLEIDAANRAYRRYTNFFEEIFTYGRHSSITAKLDATPCRVLSFNYDRLFERTFLRWACFIDPNADDVEQRIHKILNTGLGDPHEIGIDPNRFSFLKLHGGVGQFCRDRDHGMRYPYRPRLNEPIPPSTDAALFMKPGYEGDEPLLVGPNEKPEASDVTSSTQSGWSFRKYSEYLWSQARLICQQANEIHIVGYSLQFIDRTYFKEFILRSAANCKRVVLRNRGAAKFELVTILEQMREELDASWNIEFQEREF